MYRKRKTANSQPPHSTHCLPRECSIPCDDDGKVKEKSITEIVRMKIFDFPSRSLLMLLLRSAARVHKMLCYGYGFKSVVFSMEKLNSSSPRLLCFGADEKKKHIRSH